MRVAIDGRDVRLAGRLVAGCVQVAPLQAEFFAAIFPHLNQVIQAEGTLFDGAAAFRAPFASALAEIVFPLPRDAQFCVFVFDFRTHNANQLARPVTPPEQGMQLTLLVQFK